MPKPYQTTPVPLQTGTGICLIDKAAGISSHGVVNALRRRFGIKRIGHTGTLDPLASGLMICLVGRQFTKLQDSFLKLPKSYLCMMKFGFTSDTFDKTGDVTKTAEWEKLASLTEAQAVAALATFLGQQQQQVPVFSAVKIQGEKLYQKMRKGKGLTALVIPTRQVTFTELTLLAWLPNPATQSLTAQIQVTCSSGTYIRSLVHDFGQTLGVGAIVTELRRLKVGHWSVDQAQTITEPVVKLYENAAAIPIAA